ncbi:MAG TPA: FixH family protein [Verrucomicrobiae bacterium]|jgi:hypothetical protein|nr:FixH family protein [Verrucomicrobiae bacterium]
MKFPAVLSLVLALSVICAAPAFAHEQRKVAAKYDFVVGFVKEPAFSGEMNGLDVKVSQEGQPVMGLENTLKASVSKEGAPPMDLKLKTRYKEPGRYAGYFFPAQPGIYSFHITGEIKGQAIDQTFTAGPQTFSPVEDSSPLRYPK